MSTLNDKLKLEMISVFEEMSIKIIRKEPPFENYLMSYMNECAIWYQQLLQYAEFVEPKLTEDYINAVLFKRKHHFFQYFRLEPPPGYENACAIDDKVREIIRKHLNIFIVHDPERGLKISSTIKKTMKDRGDFAHDKVNSYSGALSFKKLGVVKSNYNIVFDFGYRLNFNVWAELDNPKIVLNPGFFFGNEIATFSFQTTEELVIAVNRSIDLTESLLSYFEKRMSELGFVEYRNLLHN